MPFKPLQARPTRSIPIFCLAGALALSACAQRPLVLTVPVAQSLRSPCPHPPGEEAVRTAGDLAAFSLRQEAALSVCDARREAILAAVDAHNAAAQGLRGHAAASHSP